MSDLDAAWNALKLTSGARDIFITKGVTALDQVWMRAVESGVIRFLSVSAITKFDPAQDGCNRAWYWRYVAGIKSPDTASTLLGKKLHAEIKHYLETGEDVLSPMVRVGKHFIPERGEDLIVEQPFDEVSRVLVADGVPLRGAMDLAHKRGVYLDTTGELRDDHPRTGEVIDWKSSTNVSAYAKRGDQLIETTQMAGYGVIMADSDPTLDRVRMSHVYFQTRGRKHSEKRTALFDVVTVKRKWESTENTVRTMKQVARETDGLKVDPNWDACSAFGGCFYRDRCPRTSRQAIIDLLGKAKAMSLANKLKGQGVAAGTAPASSPAPVAPASVMDPAVAAELARLRAFEESMKAPARVAPVAVINYGFCSSCGSPLTSLNASKLADGVTLMHIGCVKAPARVAPADAPPSTLASAALPVPPETIPTLPPAVQEAARLQALAVAQAQQTAATVGQTVTHSTPPASVGTGRKGRRAAGEPEASEEQDGLVLLVDVIGRGMGAVQDLDAYIAKICDSLCAAFQAIDIRCAPDNSPLGFGKWRGALSAAIKDNPPERGVYKINYVADSEIRQVAVEALAPMCATYIRGVR